MKNTLNECCLRAWRFHSLSLIHIYTRQREIDGLLEAAQTTGCRELFILPLEDEEELTVSEYKIHVLPVWKWMLKTLYLSPKQ